ncbi:MAG TPA: TRAP transporter large permease subunit [Geminicoccaceae bacterium]
MVDPHQIAGEPESAVFRATPVVRAIDRLSDAAGLISALTLFAMVGIVCYEVTSRYLFNAPTTWVIEVSAYLFVAVVFLGLAAAQKANAHIQVEILLSHLRPALRVQFETAAHWIALFFVAMTAWQMIRFTVGEYVYDTRDWGLLATPQWIPETPVCIGYLLFMAAILSDIYVLRPPRSPGAQWVLPIAAAAASLVLLLLGQQDAKISGTRFDWGTIAISAAVLVSMVAWSGLRIALAGAALVAVFGFLFHLAAGWSMLGQGLLLVGALLLLLLLGVRVAIAMGFVGLLGLYFLLAQPQLPILADRSWTSVNSFTLTAVPAFVLMGAFLVQSGITTRLFDALVYWFGRTPGGLAHATVGASAIFAAVSGSSLATAATLGSVTAPEMIRRKYSPRLTYGVVAVGSTLGILIPPSIAMIIYGSVVGAPITVLFIAGIVPGLLLAGLFMLTVFGWAVVSPDAVPRGQAYRFREKVASLLGVLPVAALIVAVLGSLYAGIATPTEVGAIGAAGAGLICLARGRLDLLALYRIGLDTVQVTSFILLIVVGAAIFSWVFDFLRLPRAMVDAITGAGLAPWVVMLMIVVLYLALGMIIESISMMLMTLSVTYPIVVAIGFDPIWFGVVLVLLVEIGLVTPPVGIVLFVLRGMSGDVPLRDIVLGVLPFLAVMLAFIALLYAFPEIATWLPSRME